jgi:hypothetical protein
MRQYIEGQQCDEVAFPWVGRLAAASERGSLREAKLTVVARESFFAQVIPIGTGPDCSSDRDRFTMA